ncbi:MAG: RimK family alpha-L-glutamate ligase [Deferribacterota bacterium]|nr:RimK family alpha-L-glutamate ligase [Deferribacterota bacterium]
MKGWILYKRSKEELKDSNYEIHRFIEEAKKADIELEIIKPEQVDIIVAKDHEGSIKVNGKNWPLPDFVIPRMGASTTYFALAVIRQLETLGVYSVNSSQAIEIVRDKLYTQQILAKNNLPIPKSMLLRFPVDIELACEYINLPVIVKTISGSQGNGVYLSEDKNSFTDLMHLLEATSPNANIIIQEFIKSSRGIDLRVITVGGRVIGCMKRINSRGGFKANFSAGGIVERYEPNPEIEWLSTTVSNIMNLDIAGVDLLFDEGHFKICECNSSPGFKGMESCVDVNVPREIFNYIKVRIGMY